MENHTTSGAPQLIYFQWYDHAFFGFMLFLSTSIGVYFSLTGGKKKDITDEYFMGGKKMSVLPIAVSLVASHVSSVSLLSVPADVYSFGAMYWLSTISIFMSAFACSYIFLPVLYELQLDSTYEYLKMRFDASLRFMCSLFFVINVILFLGIVVYVPALAYSHATGISVYYIIPVICAICTFYTTIGGLKTVVWTDTLQFSVTSIAVLIIFYLGSTKAGGLANVFNTAWKNKRLYFEFGLDPTKRETVFAVLMHWFLTYTRMLSTSQECVLKFLSLPSLRKARQSIFGFCCGIIVVKSVIVITGLIMYTLYKDCDPLSSGLLAKTDELVPYYVANVAANVPGLAGLFLSGVFCTALSTLSAIMNAVSATIYQDFIAKYLPRFAQPENTNVTIKLLVVVVGVLIAVLGMFVGHLGPIMPLAISIGGLSAGSYLGLFALGMLVPRANTKGALWGVLVSTLFVSWMFAGAQWYKSQDLIQNVPINLSTDQCQFPVAIADSNSTLLDTPPDILYIYRISYYYYAFIGGVVCMVVGVVASYLTKEEGQVDKRLLSPLVRHWVKDNAENKDYFSIDKANRIVTTADLQNLQELQNLQNKQIVQEKSQQD